MYMKNMQVTFDGPETAVSSEDFYNILGPRKWEHLYLYGNGYVENICTYVPKLVSLSLVSNKSLKNLDFLSAFENLENLYLCSILNNDLINSISKMKKGLKCLIIDSCGLHNQDLECLSSSLHTETLRELRLPKNNLITNDSKDAGLITLCQRLKKR